MIIYDKYIIDNYGDMVDIVCYGLFDEVYLDFVNGWIVVVLGDVFVLEEGMFNKFGGDVYEFVGFLLIDFKWFGEGMGIVVCK